MEQKVKMCALCHEVSLPKGNQKYCGSQHKHTGCSYKMKLATNHQYYLQWLKNHPNVLKEKEARRIKEGYYEQPHIKESLQKTRRKIYLKTGK